MEALALSVRSKCQRLAAQGLSNVAWAFATSAHFDQTLFEAIAAAAAARMPELSFQNLSNIGWAFATVQLRSVPLFEATARKVGAMATADLRDQEQGIANLV